MSLCSNLLKVQYKRYGVSWFSSSDVISLVVLTLIIFLRTTNIYSAQMTLGWDANSEDDIGGYKVYYGTSSNNYDKSNDVGNITSHTVSDLVSGITYFFAVTAYDTALNESDFSLELSHTVSDTTPPSIPANLVATAISESEIGLAWDASTDDLGVVGYKVFRDGVEIATTKVTTYHDIGLSASTTYTYSVSAFDAGGNESGKSSEYSATTLSTPVLNSPPVLSSIGSKSVNEGELLSFTVFATDTDGDILTFTKGNLPSDASFDGSTQNFSWTPGFSQEGTYFVTCEVSDGTDSDSETFTITVNNINRPPELDPIADITIDEGDTVVLSPTASDPDGDALTFAYSGWMTSDSRTTGFNDAGVHSVTVTVSDSLLTDSQEVAITVNDVDIDPPTIISVTSIGDPTKVIVVFSEPVEVLSATNASNYFSGNGITILGASLGSDLMTVTLTTDQHSEGILYTLDVINIQDLAGIPNVINPTIVTYTYHQLVISNLTVSSGKAYEIVDNGLQNEAIVYIDRGFTYVSVPTLVEGATYIKTANDDKSLIGESFLSFDVNQDVTVHVGHDDRITTKPSWLAPFTDTGDDIVSTDAPLSLFAMDFPSGTVTLGGNEGNGNSMYTVIIVGQGTGSTFDITSPSIPTNLQGIAVSSSQIDLSWDASTDNVGVTGYRIYRDGIELAITTNTVYQDTGLSELAIYTYTISAFDEAGNESEQSNEISVTTLSGDVTPPTITSISASKPKEVTVIFNESVEQESATDVSNYFIDNGITVSSASLGNDLKTVTLITTKHSKRITYTLSVINIKDLASPPNVIPLDTTATYMF